METFLHFFLLISFVIAVGMNVKYWREIDNIKFSISRMQVDYDDVHMNLIENIEELDAILKDLKANRSELAANDELTKPMKPNNWKSMKKVFQKPGRIDLDE